MRWHRKKELVDRAQAVAHVFKLARIERDAWLNPRRISGQMASTLGAVDAARGAGGAAVREHLIEELGGCARAWIDGWTITKAGRSNAWRDGLTPDPLLTVSEWSDRHRMLSSKASAEPGTLAHQPHAVPKAIMDCLSPTSPVERVVFMKAGAAGATEMG